MELVLRLQVNIIGIIIAISLLVSLKWAYKKTNNTVLFQTVILLTLIELVLDSIFWCINGKDISYGRIINVAVNYIYYIIQMPICYLWCHYCQRKLGIKRSNALKKVEMVPCILGELFVVMNIWTGMLFTVTADNIYVRTPEIPVVIESIFGLFYPIYSTVMIAHMAISRRNRNIGMMYLAITSIIPVISTIVQFNCYGVNIIWAGSMVAVLFVYTHIQVKQYEELEKKIVNNEIEIMISQIQPHFLYNVLSSIRALCIEDNDMALKAIDKFSLYLRGNMQVLGKQELVSFEQELAHVNNYIELEKLRFGDKLCIEYNINYRKFSVPSLCLQPIIENAVKHGITQKKENGIIKIQTQKKNRNIEIIVEDNGVGFEVDNACNDGNIHIGIKNVRERIQIMCNGTVRIESKRGIGTKVIITIPMID